MRRRRFDPSVPSVSQHEFYESNFLKYYRETSKDPDYITIVDGLKILDGGSGDFGNLIGELQNQRSDYDVIRIYSSEMIIGTKPFYIYMNEQLYKDDNHTISKLMPLIRRATFQINDKPPMRSYIVYRGIDLKYELKKLFQIGTIFRFPGFISASKNQEKAKSFGNTLFVIHVDSYCCHVRDISDISLFPEEEELLFSPYSLFEVASRDDDVITLTSHDNMQDIGMNTTVEMIDESQPWQVSSVDEDHDTDDIATTDITTTNYEQHIQSKPYSKKKHHKKSCSIQ